MNITKNLGMLLLSIYLILVGLNGVAHFYTGMVAPLVALVAGILILLGK
jgi:hypothetical protein